MIMININYYYYYYKIKNKLYNKYNVNDYHNSNDINH